MKRKLLNTITQKVVKLLIDRFYLVKLKSNSNQKIVLETIKPSTSIDSIQRRKQILKDFQDFKKYLLAFDNDNDEGIQSISDLLPTNTSLTSKTKKKAAANSKRRKVVVESEDDSADGNFQP